MHGPFTYIGGKSRLAKQIIACFPPHRCYVEPFAGGAQVFFRKPPSSVEVLNDMDGEVVNFFRICQSHPTELLRCLRYYLVSRQWFDLAKKTDPVTLTDIHRAVRFFYLQRVSFGARVASPTYGYLTNGMVRFRPSRFPAMIQAAHSRLEHTQIECLRYQDVLTKYDRRETLFYLDPPYWKMPYYRHNFTQSDFVELETRLRMLKGTFILSLNDRPEVRQMFRRFTIKPVETSYSLTRQTRDRPGRELLIHNIAGFKR